MAERIRFCRPVGFEVKGGYIFYPAGESEDVPQAVQEQPYFKMLLEDGAIEILAGRPKKSKPKDLRAGNEFFSRND